MKSTNFSIKTTMFTFVIFIFLLFLFNYFTNAFFEKQKYMYLENTAKEQKTTFKRAEFALEEMATLTFQTLINNNQIKSLIYKANEVDDVEKDKIRNEIYSLLSDKYEFLKQRHLVKQLHFHLPGAISFLRFHNSKVFGDPLSNFRYSIKKLNETKKNVFGFEEGRMLNGFRHVYPLFYKNEFIGSVEISFGFDAISQILTINKNATELFVISRNLIEEYIYIGNKNKYKEFNLSSKWLIDVDSYREMSTDNSIQIETLNKINKKIRKEYNIDKDLTEDKDILKIVNVDNVFYTVNFTPIKNVKDKLVSWRIKYKEDEFLNSLESHKKTSFLLNTLISTVLSSIFYLWIFLMNRRKNIDKNCK